MKVKIKRYEPATTTMFKFGYFKKNNGIIEIKSINESYLMKVILGVPKAGIGIFQTSIIS